MTNGSFRHLIIFSQGNIAKQIVIYSGFIAFIVKKIYAQWVKTGNGQDFQDKWLDLSLYCIMLTSDVLEERKLLKRWWEKEKMLENFKV